MTKSMTVEEAADQMRKEKGDLVRSIIADIIYGIELRKEAMCKEAKGESK